MLSDHLVAYAHAPRAGEGGRHVEQSEDCEALTIRKLKMATGCNGRDLGHSEREDQFSGIIADIR